ncbi:MAG: TIGR00341 family protein [Gemmatimonadota bacterium]|nr:TIGR00341 family protein [Gemmatimonadota bacterium]
MDESKPVMERVEETAGEQLGVREWDRPGIFQDTASAATDADLPYWLVLVLSGAIATLGLALDSSAVVIGAMLVAPLLAPVIGLALALAMGDARLALQTGAVVLASTFAVVLAGALLTVLLPFQTITPEISARTQPTTLDLAIAVFSGLVGALVTVARGKRLSAAIPGVAIAVALIPPLAVAGFGIGSGWNTEIIRGSLLLYGANLAGIVLSGMTVFLLIGMHRRDVLRTVVNWRKSAHPTGLAAWVGNLPWVCDLGTIRSPWARVGMVLGFVVALAFPLSQTLSQIAREQRVRGAIASAAEVFQVPGRSSVLSRQIIVRDVGTQVFLRVATAEWFDAGERETFEREASAAAGEPVQLVLEQLPASGGDLEQLAGMILPQSPRPALPPPPPTPTRLPNLLAEVRQRLQRAAGTLPVPDGVEFIGIELSMDGAGRTLLGVGYAAANPLPPEAEQILARQLAATVGEPGMEARMLHVPTTPIALGAAAPDGARLREVSALLLRFPRLRIQLLAGEGVSAEERGAALELLTDQGIERSRITQGESEVPGLWARLRPAPERGVDGSG